MKEKCILVDLDGTLCNINHRLKYLENKKIFHKLCYLDKPDDKIVSLVQLLSNYYKIIIVTCRPKSVENLSIEWLKNHNINFYKIFSRNDNDDEHDDKIKLKFLKEIQKDFDVEFSLDDRDSVVKMFRENGIKCLQVNYGNF